jgi:hypothetical protein
MSRPAAIAFRAYLAPMLATRGFKLSILFGFVYIGLAGLAMVLGEIAPGMFAGALESIRLSLIVPGIPVAAVLFGEMPLRDGIRQRTLLYQLLGPAPRPVLAAVRTLMTAGLLAVGACALMLATRILGGAGLENYGREMWAMVLGALAYTGIFGLIHVANRRGLIGGLAFYFVLDQPLGQIPFALRRLSPSYHLSVLADRVIEIHLPVSVTPPEPSMLVSSLVLIVIGVVTTAATAILFTRKSLGELC